MRTLVRGAICGLILMLAACGSGLEGKYSGTMPGAIGLPIPATMDFRSGGKVFVMRGSVEKAGTFEVDGDKVTIIVDGQSAVFTRHADGTLAGPNDMRFAKFAGNVLPLEFANPGAGFVGTWDGFYRPDAGSQFETTPSSEYVIAPKGSLYSVTIKTVADGRSFSQTFLYRDGKLLLAGADGQPEPPDPLTGTTPEIALLGDGSLRIVEEGEIRLRRRK